MREIRKDEDKKQKEGRKEEHEEGRYEGKIKMYKEKEKK